MNKKTRLLLFLLSLLLLFSSCGKKPGKKSTDYEKREKAPQNLNKIYENTSLILKDIEKINKIPIEPEPEENVEEENSKSKDENKEKKESKEEKLTRLWKDVDRNIKKVHVDWNNYEIEGIKKVGNTDNISKFGESLNNFTIAIENRDHLNIITEGSQVFLNISPFFDIYKDEIKGDICRIKYSVYQSYILENKGEKERAAELISQGEGYLNGIRQKIGDDKEKLKILEKLTLSLSDMKKAIQKESSSLFKIKRDIVLNNLESLKE